MDNIDQQVSDNIFIRTKKLIDPMGIIYPSASMKYEKGVSWTRAKVKSMEEGSPDDYIVVSLIVSLRKFRFRLISLKRSKRPSKSV